MALFGQQTHPVWKVGYQCPVCGEKAITGVTYACGFRGDGNGQVVSRCKRVKCTCGDETLREKGCQCKQNWPQARLWSIGTTERAVLDAACEVAQRPVVQEKPVQEQAPQKKEQDNSLEFALRQAHANMKDLEAKLAKSHDEAEDLADKFSKLEEKLAKSHHDVDVMASRATHAENTFTLVVGKLSNLGRSIKQAEQAVQPNTTNTTLFYITVAAVVLNFLLTIMLLIR